MIIALLTGIRLWIFVVSSDVLYFVSIIAHNCQSLSVVFCCHVIWCTAAA